MLDEQALALEIDRVPAEPADLARAQARGDRELDQDPLVRDIESAAQSRDLGRVEDVNGALRRFRFLHIGRGVVCHEADALAVAKHGSEERQDLRDGAR
ncbi:MAG TPA: hypothetical protein VHY75_02935 [Steroidobacteraceae bacterium]|nr:hypothetical protein [Steroidobacteraceae bacterium]